MIITKSTLDKLPKKDQNLIAALLIDLEEINHNLSLRSPNIQLDWIDKHTEYSPERVDPCPDYYGMYRVIQGNKVLGVEMDIDTLDTALCLLYNFVIDD